MILSHIILLLHFNIYTLVAAPHSSSTDVVPRSVSADTSDSAVPPYILPKRTVRWDIENCNESKMQVKKILVDMLLWAADNRAPSNILLITGDRDFSHALHCLRMRGYNILLAAHTHTSAGPVAAAAKSIWRWSTIMKGGVPPKVFDRGAL